MQANVFKNNRLEGWYKISLIKPMSNQVYLELEEVSAYLVLCRQVKKSATFQ